MILVDANIIMYAAGASHIHKTPSIALLEQVARGDIEAAIDAEVLQEILHRYRAINRWKEGRLVYDLTRQIFSNVVPVTATILDRARMLLDSEQRIMARDAVHAAVVFAEHMEAVWSYDRDFDRIAGLVRLEPGA